VTLFAFGDDHARAAFARCDQVKPHCFGRYTMRRLSSHDGAFASLQLAQPQSGDTMIYMVGAEDVRRHLTREASEADQDVSVLIDELATSCAHRVHWLTSLFDFPLQVCIVGVVPPAEPMWDDPTVPAFGSFEQRRTAREALNAALRTACRNWGVAFVDIPKLYETRRGALRPVLSDGRGHIAPDQAHHLCAAVGAAIGADLSHRRPSALARLRLRIAREWVLRAGDATALAALGIGA
jgi:hypothetical protein